MPDHEWRSVPMLSERSFGQWYNKPLFGTPPSAQRQMSGTLFVVATPIGNLEDVTIRALRVLREADLVAAEDTRQTAKLLTHHGISTPRLSVHEHNLTRRLPGLLRRLDAGASIALVSDAGTPGVSDPGVRLVQACRAHGIRVTVVPGPSALLTAVVAAGFPMNPLSFYGFAPARSNDRKRWISGLLAVEHTLVFFEAPHRIRQTLKDMSMLLGSRQIVVARELTKVHEEVISGTPSSVLEQMRSPLGELTIVVGPTQTVDKDSVILDDQLINAEFRSIAESGGVGRRQAIVSAAARLGMSPRAVYAAVERVKDQS